MSFRNRLALFLMATLVCVQAATAVFAYAFLRGQIVERGKRELSDAMQSFTQRVVAELAPHTPLLPCLYPAQDQPA